MTDKEKEAIEKLKETSKQCHNSKECWKKEDCPDCYVEVEDIFAIEIVLNLIQTQQAEIENYKKQKIYDKQFKHELLEEIKCKELTIDSLNKILDDRLICIQGGRGLYAKLKGLDKEYLIREYLSMYKICKEEIEKYKYLYQKALDNTIKSDRELLDKKAELEKKDKIIDEAIGFLATRTWATCPNEDCGANLDCENRCSNDDNIYEECWKMYFERKSENEN